MNTVIWKFLVTNPVADEVSMPTGAEILHVDMQHGNVCMWAKVDPDAPQITREFMIEGTGQPPNVRLDDAIHRGTMIDGRMGMVWHLFEVEGG